METKHLRQSILLIILSFVLPFGKNVFSQCSVSAGSNKSICPGASVTLKAVSNNGNPGSYSWTSNPAGFTANTKNITVSPSVATKYMLHSTGNGCNSYDTVQVSIYSPPAEPVFTYSMDTSCSGTMVNFSTPAQSGVSFTWSFGDGGSGTGNNVSHSYHSVGNGPSSFTVVVTATGNHGCTESHTIVISIPQNTAALLQPGAGVDSSTFNGALTFFICAAAAQQAAMFSFVNGSASSADYTTKIIWGDTSAPYVNSTGWTNVSHIYRRGIFNLVYIVSNNITGCTDTTFYKVFYGSNPAGGIASPGNTDICGPDWLTFSLYNFQNNTAGTIYTVAFSDSTPPLIFNHPPPDSISHYFERSSCGFSSSNGITNFPNSFSASLTIENPCGLTAGSVVPIYVSLRPEADFSYGNVCVNSPSVFTNTSQNGMAAGNSACNQQTPIIWSITPDTGWTVTSGNMGKDNGYVDNNFNPALWTSGSNTLSVSFTAAGNYQFQIIAGNKCSTDTTGKLVCVSAPAETAFSLSTLTGCAPLFDSVVNITPPPPGCSVPSFEWSIVQNNSTCTGSGLNFEYLNGTNPDSSTTYLRFNNEGTYNIQLNATNVCGTYSSIKTVVVKTKPQIGITIPPTTCFGQSVAPTANVLSCGGNISDYTWSFPGGTPASSTSQNPGMINYPVSGQYAVSLSAQNECGIVSTNKSVNIDTIPMAMAGNDQQICSAANTQIGSTPLNGLTYSWSPIVGLSSSSVANPVVSIINNGVAPISQTYYLTVSNPGNCSSTDSVVITVYPAATVNAGPDVSICSGQSISLNGAFGGVASSITWTSNNAGTFSDSSSIVSSFTPLFTTGQATLTITTNDPTGPCPAAIHSMNLTMVAPPTANAGNDVAICSGSSVQIGTQSQNGYTYTWAPTVGLSDSTISNPVATINNTTNGVIMQAYLLTVGAVGCSDTNSVTVSVYPAPLAQVVAPVSTCAGTPINITGSISGSAAYATWHSTSGTFASPDSLNTNFTPSVSSGIALAYLITDNPLGPCPADTVVLQITVNSPPVVSVNIDSQTICSGDSTDPVTLSSSTTGMIYTWTATSSGGVTGFISSGTDSIIPAQRLVNNGNAVATVLYSITSSSSNCGGIPITFTIRVNPIPTLSLPAPQIICTGDTTTIIYLSSTPSGGSFSWTSSNDSNILGNIASGTGNIPAHILQNNKTTADTVIYHITPSVNGCEGSITNYLVIVNPKAVLTTPPATQTICSGQSTSPVNLTSTSVGSSVTWQAFVPDNITGAIHSGSGVIPAQTLFNSIADSASSILYIQYSISILSNISGCGTTNSSYSIGVRPIPQIDFDITGTGGCSPLNSYILPKTSHFSTADSLTINWGDGTSNAVIYPKLNKPIWSPVQHSFYNNNSDPVTYQVSMIVHSACLDTTIRRPVTVSPGSVNAFFTSSPSTGCEPLTVTFQDQSSNGALLSWCFDYDLVNKQCNSGGKVTPAGSAVSHTFAAGTHTIALYAAQGAGCAQDTIYQTIYVSPSPVASFIPSNNLCAQTEISFTSSSTSPPGSFLSQYQWNFGDGASSLSINPVHEYGMAGTYNVCLTATSSSGCYDSICQPVTIVNRPEVNFEMQNLCVNTQDKAFQNLSSGAEFYQWYFGDNTSSAAVSPLHPYQVAGTYSVMLVGSTQTCSDTVRRSVTIYPLPEASFTIPVEFGCGLPAYLTLKNTSKGAIGYQWDFGDGNSSTFPEPIATYVAEGAYIISLIATNNFNCSDTTQLPVSIHPSPTIESAQILPYSGCQPVNVRVNVTAANAKLFVWDFGDGTSVQGTSPNVAHLYEDAGTYTIVIRAYSYSDCGDTLSMADTVKVYIRPVADFDYETDENQQPATGTVNFTNSSLHSTSYLWNFSDGFTSTEENPAHTFPDVNQFDVMLVASTPHGCSDTAYKNIDVIKKTLFVPNAFAPDFNSGNDLVKVWKPAGVGMREYHAQIFNKWGELLWESYLLDENFEPAEGWDGKYQGKDCQQDVYVWKIEAVFLDGSRWNGMRYPKEKMRKSIGSVTLIR
ncbi:MAG: PKD domain-containing protein [Bacteroidetes bacterium]|nr:PKD domain-containing protein [Bacteroidota bacterium]